MGSAGELAQGVLGDDVEELGVHRLRYRDLGSHPGLNLPQRDLESLSERRCPAHDLGGAEDNFAVKRLAHADSRDSLGGRTAYAGTGLLCPIADTAMKQTG